MITNRTVLLAMAVRFAYNIIEEEQKGGEVNVYHRNGA